MFFVGGHADFEFFLGMSPGEKLMVQSGKRNCIVWTSALLCYACVGYSLYMFDKATKYWGMILPMYFGLFIFLMIKGGSLNCTDEEVVDPILGAGFAPEHIWHEDLIKWMLTY